MNQRSALSRALVFSILAAITLACNLSTITNLVSNEPTPTAVVAAPPASSGNLVVNAVTAKDVKGDTFDPVGITDSFAADQKTFHAIVSIKDAPANTKVRANWLTASNTKIGEFELASDGSRNLDFSFKPDAGSLPSGSYKVEIYVNGKLDRTLNFSVGQSATRPTTQSSTGSCPPPPTIATTSPGFPIKITMAEATSGAAQEPVNPTRTFKTNSVIHAVVAIQNAPKNTEFEAIWTALDTGGAADCNSSIDTYNIESDGTRNLDFNLTPTGSWPPGTYQVQIAVNGKTALVQSFSVK